jgi:hypothetical protein
MEKLSTIQQINQSIMFGTWTDTELSSMIDAIKWNRAQLQKQVKRSISIGQTVKFTSAKRGMTMQGTVDKIAIKYITVRTPQGLWRVPANMLEVV